MKSLISITTAIIVSAVLIAFIPKGEVKETLSVGAKAPMADAKMEGIDDKKVSLKDLNQENGLLVIFSCNTCPFVVGSGDKEGWEGRYNGIAADCKSKKVGMMLINSNEAKRDKGDNLDDMKSRAKEMGYTMAYVLDKNSELANAFGATTTPHVFLFDKDLKLVYRGKIDENVNSASDVKEPYLNNALQNLVEGKAIDPQETKSLGCSIKRVG